jgi:hypothetical protein
MDSDDGSGPLKINQQGMVDSFMLSVGNDSLWTPLVESSVKICYDQFADAGGDLECEGLLISRRMMPRVEYFETSSDSMGPLHGRFLCVQ